MNVTPETTFVNRSLCGSGKTLGTTKPEKLRLSFAFHQRRVHNHTARLAGLYRSNKLALISGGVMYYEELMEGERYTTGKWWVTEREVLDFARVWDPQPFHVDANAAQSSIFGSLITCGLHTLVITYRLFNELGILGNEALAGLGYENVKFLKPVYPDDILEVDVRVAGLSDARRPGCGVVRFELTTYNQHRIEVLSLSLSILTARRSRKQMSAAMNISRTQSRVSSSFHALNRTGNFG
jgi:acyl dehydratase